MKGNTFRKTVSALASVAMVAQLGFIIPASAEIVQTELSNETFDSYTASANTEVVDEAGNKVLKVSNGANVTFSNIFSQITDVGYLTMDINFVTGITGTANKDYSGAYFAFAQDSSKLGTAMKVYGSSTDTSVPVGYVYGGGSGQYGEAGNATIGDWYTVRCEINKGDSQLSYTFYDRDDYAEKETEATPVITRAGMGFRNGQVPTSLILSMDVSDGEYYYIDNVRTFTEEDPDAEETLESVTFSTTPGSIVTGPEEAEATGSYPVELSILGSKGSDLSEADGISIDWDVKGLTDVDGYLGTSFEKDNANGSISVKNGVGNFYGIITATVTYKDVVMTAEYKLVVTGSVVADENRIYPPAGYSSDLNTYADDMVGYRIGGTADSYQDVILPNWSMYGSNSSRYIELMKDENGDKYMQFESAGGSGSTLGINRIGTYTDQFIIDMKVRPSNGTEFVYSERTPNDAERAVRAFTVTATPTSFTAGDQTLSGLTDGGWNRLIISCDMSVGEYWIAAYDAEGNYIGKTDPVATTSCTPTYFSVYGTLPAGIKDLTIYKPVLESITINSDDGVQVPEEGSSANTLDLSASMLSDQGLDVTGEVEWSIEGVAGDLVSIESTGAQTAQLSVLPGAAGTVKVIARKGSVQAEKDIRLITSSNSVVFTSGVSNITIPFSGEDNVVESYEAAVYGPDSDDPLDGQTITYKLYDKTGTIETTVKGVTFENGVLTVTPDASPAVVYIVAQNQEGLTARMRVNIHGLSFAFGSGEPEEGYTQVINTMFSNSSDYGFAGIDGLTVNETDITGSAAYTFKVRVPNGNYNVKVSTTSQNMTSEVVENVPAVTGINKTGDSFQVAVCDEVLDLTFEAGSSITSLEISQATAKSRLEKPAIYSIGDSTTKNSGHYSKYNEDKAAQASDPSKWVDEREYCSWGNAVTEDMYEDTFSAYYNHGMAGRDSVNYYNQARVEAVLLSINPGDYVTINMGINSREANEGGSYETLMEYYYVLPVIQRGGIPVILTHTPDGPLSGYGTYDEATKTFDCSRENDGRVIFLKNLAEKYDLNVIDIGKLGNDYLTSLAQQDLTVEQIQEMSNKANSINQGYTAPTTVLEMVQSWYPDHNHYTVELGTVYANIIMTELAKIANSAPQPDEYIVTFMADDAEVATRTVVSGETVTDIPAVPAKEGFTGKWMANGVEFTSSTVVTGNMTVTAEYTPITEPTGELTVTSFALTEGTAAATVSNTTESAASVTVYVAAYDEAGTLVSVQLQTKSVAADGTETFEVANSSEAASYKAFVWNDANNAPLANAQ